MELEYGSIQERIAIHAKKRENRIRRLEALMPVKAMLKVAGAIINPEELKLNDLNKIISQYSDLLFPELEIDRKQKEKDAIRAVKKASKQVWQIKVAGGGRKRGITRKNKQ